MPFAEDSYTGNGSAKEFNISFAYILESHIEVALNEVVTTAFTVNTSTNPKKVVMNTLGSETSTQTTTGAPKAGVNVVVQRRSSLNAALVDYTDGSTLIADDLDKSNTQFLFLLQEQDDEQAANIKSTIEGQDAQSKKIINVNNPTNAQDAATKNYVDTGFQPLDAELTELATMSSGTAGALADLTQAETQILDGATVSTSELNTLDGITASTSELNKLDGVTASTAELNKLDGVTASTAELNIVDGVTATAAEINALDGITASTAELNKLDGATSSTAEINLLDGVTATTAELNFVDGVTSAIQNQIDGKQPLDSELTELATMPATTASALADLTQAEVQVLDGATLSTTELNTLDGVTSTTTELNVLDGVTATTTELNVTDGLTASTAEINQLDGKTVSSTLTPANTNDIPTSSAVNTFVSGLLNALGGFVAIANELSFPTTNPDPSDNAGTVVSIADAGGVVVDASGVSATGRTTGNVTVTINGFPSSLHNATLGAGLGLQVQTTTTLNTYTYHKLIAKEADVKQLSDDINDFQARYRVSDNAPTTDLDEGDLWYDKTANKMKVYDTSTSAWKEVQSVGNFFINTLSSSSATGGGSATFNGSAYRFTLSNAGANAQQMLVSVNGVIQKPNSGTSQPSEGFAINNNDIIFAAAPASGASHFIITQGSTVNIGQPSNNTVDTSELVDGAVNNAKVSSSAAIALSKLATGALPSAITVASSNIVDGTIVNADVNASAAIAGTKVIPNFGSQNVITTGKIEVGTVIDLNANGTATFSNRVNAGSNTLDELAVKAFNNSSSSPSLFCQNFNSSGDVFLAANASNTTVARIGVDGSADFAGRVLSNLWFQSDRTNASGSVLYGTLNGTEKVNIRAEGSASFQGDVGIGGSNNPNVSLANIGLKADGSATFNGAVIGKGLGPAYAFEITNGTTNMGGLYRDSAGANLYLKNSSGTNNVSILSNGAATFASYNDSSSSGFGVNINVNSNTGDVRTQTQSTASQYTQMYGAYFGSSRTFHVLANGNVQNTNNSYGAISDVKLKENIVDANSQWNDIKDIRVRNYNFIEGQTHTQLGVVAQEIETVSPGLVADLPDTDNKGNDLGTITKSVNYSVLYMKAVKALQEAMTRIETLETQNASLEARLTTLEGAS